MGFPDVRMRRLRRTEGLRRLVAETRLSPSQLVYPLFVEEGLKGRKEIEAMPGQYRLGIEELLTQCEQALELGIGGIILFGIPRNKDPMGRGAWDPKGIVPTAVREIKKRLPELVVICDVCLCEYTDHGHCGLVHKGDVDNDATLELLAKAAVAYAKAGADIVAPSDMMDGRVGEIREALDEAGFEHVPIMSYAAKYASAFYGPFRAAADSAPAFGDRRGYQMDPPNIREALREVALDVEEGADIVMVKPALAYLDVIAHVRDEFDLPVAAYNVSGEYAMVKAAAARGWVDEKRVVKEILLAIARAGADIILTYHALDAAKWLKQGW